MTTLGLVGGLGPESTIDYYRRILEAWEREEPRRISGWHLPPRLRHDLYAKGRVQ